MYQNPDRRDKLVVLAIGVWILSGESSDGKRIAGRSSVNNYGEPGGLAAMDGEVLIIGAKLLTSYTENWIKKRRKLK